MRLYKYCDAGGVEILRSSSIKVSSPTEFNDPFDFNPIPDTMSPGSRGALRELIKGASTVWQCISQGTLPPGAPEGTDLAELRRKFEVILENRMSDTQQVHDAMLLSMEKLAVLCLTARRNHHLMWAHYGDRHRGLVIELESEGIFRTGDDSSVHNRLVQVQYSDDRPVFRYDEVLSPAAYTTKGKAWSYEEEWRVIYHQTQFVPLTVGGRELHLLSIPPQSIKSVLLGSRMPDAQRREVRHLLSNPLLSHVQLVQMELDLRSYQLREVPVTLL